MHSMDQHISQAMYPVFHGLGLEFLLLLRILLIDLVDNVASRIFFHRVPAGTSSRPPSITLQHH